jgi:hypothetical protein
MDGYVKSSVGLRHGERQWCTIEDRVDITHETALLGEFLHVARFTQPGGVLVNGNS